MSKRYNHSVMSTGFAYGKPRVVTNQYDTRPFTCANGHGHASDDESRRCTEANMSYPCSQNHCHACHEDSIRCDNIRREEMALQDRENERQHQSDMMEKQIRFAEELRSMGYSFKTHSYPALNQASSKMPMLSWKNN